MIADLWYRNAVVYSLDVEAGRFVRPEDLDDHVRVSCELERHVDWLRADAELGFDAIYLHNVSRDQDRFIDDCGARVLPELR